MTKDTSGRNGYASFEQSDRPSWLESKFRARTDSLGSTLYSLTWKRRATPAGRSISALRASARRTGGSVPTSPPFSPEAPSTPPELGWPTTTAQDGNSAARTTRGLQDMTLTHAARLAAWATPAAAEAGGTPEQMLARKEGLPCGQSVTSLALQAQLAVWATPNATGANRGGQEKRTGGRR